MLPCRAEKAPSADSVLIVHITPDAAADLRRLSQMRQSAQGEKGTWRVDAASLSLRCWTVAMAVGMADDHGSMTDFVHGVVAPAIAMPRQTALFRILMTGPGVVVDNAGPVRGYLPTWRAEQIEGPGRITVDLTTDGVKFVIGDVETTRWALDSFVGPATAETA